ncbi:UNVERIFIED_CONTAM: hypothetical protein Sradi_3138900 [Sesamum radiatum]|uniref:Uncharacterized protein n=1 Tax=Sesamum radiatum TaxID=300843 RepID=A0AAW2RE60_SESRA
MPIPSSPSPSLFIITALISSSCTQQIPPPTGRTYNSSSSSRVQSHQAQSLLPPALIPGTSTSTPATTSSPTNSPAASAATSFSTPPPGSPSSLSTRPVTPVLSPPFPGLSPYLQNLDFSNNNFSGSIPESFSLLTRLQRLGLSRNSLTGSIPDSLGSLAGLEEMYLDNNMLSGAIPLSFNGLKNLKRLEIQGNKISGAFPELTQLGSLNFLDASDNAISGELPPGLPPSLIELAMRSNQIEGNIPGSVANLVSLQVLDLSHNNLSGSVPAGLFTHPSLEQLTLSYNQFGLSALALENNKFSGMIPTQYVLKVLGTGEGGLAQFERLLLGGNYLLGPVPGAFLDLKAGSVTVRLGDNCLYRCPVRLFFCVRVGYKSP